MLAEQRLNRCCRVTSNAIDLGNQCRVGTVCVPTVSAHDSSILVGTNNVPTLQGDPSALS
jgi:hypothetical protein